MSRTECFISYILITGLLISSMVFAKPVPPTLKVIRVAIIDTGYSKKHNYKVKIPICKTGHYDFTLGNERVGWDLHGHGTGMSAIIANQAGEKGYCLLHYKIFGFFGGEAGEVAKAINKAVTNGARVINLSLEGMNYSYQENRALLRAASKGVRVFVAAGNSHNNQDKRCSNYPACYRNIKGMKVIGALDQYGLRASYSNYGRKLTWYPDYIMGVGGTSGATAMATGEYIKWLLNR